MAQQRWTIHLMETACNRISSAIEHLENVPRTPRINRLILDLQEILRISAEETVNAIDNHLRGREDTDSGVEQENFNNSQN